MSDKTIHIRPLKVRQDWCLRWWFDSPLPYPSEVTLGWLQITIIKIILGDTKNGRIIRKPILF